MKNAIEELQGVWNVIQVETEGYTLPTTFFKGATMSIRGERFVSIGIGNIYQGIIYADPDASPKTLDLQFTAGPDKGRTDRGIYELNDNELKICLAIRGKPRPGKFTAERGTGFAIEKLKRDEN